MARHCLNMQSGDVSHWPFPSKDWKANASHLTAMQAVWRAWRFFSKPTSKWEPEDIDYFDWLNTDD
jgi:hypothetical protein